MKPSRFCFLGCLLACTSLPAQFKDPFLPGHDEPASLNPWRVFSGDGEAEIAYTLHKGFARIRVDASRDRRNTWWAVFQNNVQDSLDLSRLEQPGYELRVEARIRSSHAPRRVNLSFHTQRTTDYHTNLMEFDIPHANTWKTISLTTRDFEARLGDSIGVQLALMDWGTEVYTLDVDYINVDVVRTSDAEPDLGEPIPYHPPAPPPGHFANALHPVVASTIDSAFPDVGFRDWTRGDHPRVLSLGGSRAILLKWDFSNLSDLSVDGPGVLQITTLSHERKADPAPDSGLVRVVEILRSPASWDDPNLTFNDVVGHLPPNRVFNPQMIIDQPAAPVPDSPNRWVISRPALQRLIDGETVGLALLPLGPIHASFFSNASDNPQFRPVLQFNTK